MDPERISERASDYTIEYSKDEKGRLRKKSVYKGPEFYYVLPNEVRMKARLLLAAFIILSVVFTMIPLLVADQLMHKWYTSLPLIVCLFGDVHLIMAFVRFVTSKEPLKREDNRACFERLAIWSLLNTIFSFTSLSGQIIWHFKNGFQTLDTLITVSTLLLLVSSILVFNAKGCAEAKEQKG
ncbi:MAG: hypothetical protein K5871_03750 [Lachnospiraceae bacterium]|nr:hypothetical protein [Lachnospiraceae bacterium]